MFTSKIVYCLWVTLAKEDDNFVIQTTKPLPKFKNWSEQEQIRFIRERILGKSNERLVQVSDLILLNFSISLFTMKIMRITTLVSVVRGMTKWKRKYKDKDNRSLLKPQESVSRKSRNFSGPFRVTWFSLHVQNEGTSKHATLQLFQCLFPSRHTRRIALQNKQFEISGPKAFRETGPS